MKEEKTAVKNPAGKENEPMNENVTKKKTKEEKPPTKVVIRRLPPTMTEEQFKVQVSPMPDHDYFYFVPADMTLMPNAFSRAYINFVDQNDLFIFTQKFDGYVFVDSKGGEFPAVVEFAPFQRIPKNRPGRKKDPKMGTIESDPRFIAFKERLEAENFEKKAAANASKQHFFETSLAPEKKEEINNTPLLEYIRNKRAERQRIREEKREEKRKKDLERRRAKEEQRRVKKDDDGSVMKVLNSQSVGKERSKEKDSKQSFVKKKSEEIKTTVKEKVSIEARSREGKARSGKSYLEERQRQAERREEQRKKLSQSQSFSSVSDLKSQSAIEDNLASSGNGEKTSEETSGSVIEGKNKETEIKKPERSYKKEERRSSYKYENKREKDDDSRRSRRTNDRGYQSSRRDDERSEEGGRKRYSESRRSHDSSQRDRYKDKTKSYGQKKTESLTDLNKGKTVKENSDQLLENNTNSEKAGSDVKGEIKEETTSEVEQIQKLGMDNENKENAVEESKNNEPSPKSRIFESTKPVRRRSMDYDKTRSSSSYSKSYSREKFTEKKRRNSVGSSKHSNENLENFSQETEKDKSIEEDKKVIKIIEKTITDEDNTSTEPQNEATESDEKLNRERELRKEFEDKDREIPKRRNSTGERLGPEKMSPRRNSLGSEDKNQEVKFKEHKVDGEVISEEEKSKDENKHQKNMRDPRTERRIRNKDRPSIEIYRPGMGKFSKQRLEREREKEKGLGSSTEVDSPSPSPSPTPVLRHKSTTPTIH